MARDFSHVQNEVAYENAIQARIKANAALTRRRQLDAAIKDEPVEFRAWLFSDTSLVPAINALRIADQEAFDAGEDESHAGRAYQKAVDEFSRSYGHVPEFLWQSLEQWGGLTDKQLEVARRIFAERQGMATERAKREAERRASAPAWTEGRQTITGVVQSARWETSSFGYNASSTSLKGLVLLADGRKLWGTIPAFAYNEAPDALEWIKGEEVTFTVTVKPSDDDPTMAFGSRPVRPVAEKAPKAPKAAKAKAESKKAETAPAPAKKAVPVCKKCGREHWYFVRCSDLSQEEN